jgi:cytoskeletal protein RodZ
MENQDIGQKPEAPLVQQPAQTEPLKNNSYNRKKLIIIILAVVALGLAVLAGVLWFTNKDSKTDKSKSQTTASSSSSSNSSEEDKSTSTKDSEQKTKCSPDVTQTEKDAIAAAISTQDYAALKPYMADTVNVVYAASEKGGDETQDQAVADMRYLNISENWDFNLSKGVTDVWAAHFYKNYFVEPFFAGRAETEEVVSFQFDDCAKIRTIFVASSYNLLES